MSQQQPPEFGSQPSAADEEYSLPCAEALLAGTLALMTGHMQACCDTHRTAMARKIVANLQMLGQMNAFTPHFRTMLWNLQGRWAEQGADSGGQPAARKAPSSAELQRALWVAAPETVQ
ncbi:hypothetical protein [Paracidovorax sp. MALMAid1276]|uniref:hypothetical protein n=1 Tax=Paracidovorax sp. MALMAid1276 TaxID=3411631 RepID=UPI003B9D01FB